MKKFLSLIMTVVTLAALPGCSSTELMRKIDRQSDENSTRIDSYSKKVGKEVSQSKTMNGAWLGSKPVPTRMESKLPPVFSETITLQFPDRVSLSTIAERITKVSGVRIRLNPDVFIPASAFTPSSASTMTTAGLPGGNSAVPGQNTPTGGMTGSTVARDFDLNMSLNYVGPLSGVLDVIAARSGISWDYNDGEIALYRFQTRMFTLKALPGVNSVKASVGKDGGGSSGSAAAGGSGTQNTGITGFSSSSEAKAEVTALSVWDGLDKAIRAIMSPLGKVSISQSTGTIVITDTKETVNQVARLIENENRMATRQVNVKLEVFSVITEDNENFGIDWNVAYRRIDALSDNRWSMSLASPVTSISENVAKLGLSVLAADAANPKGFDGSSVFFQAISEQGRVSRVTSSSITTSNNQPAPFALTDQTGYLASTTPAAATTGGITSTPGLTPGMVTTGFVMSMLPTILDNSRVLLQLSLDISELKKINSVTSGDQTIQTPEISSQQVLQRIVLKAGETLVITAFERVWGQYDRRGVSEGSGVGLGGSIKGNNKRETIVVLLTPTLLEGA